MNMHLRDISVVQGPREAWRQLPAALGLRWQGLLRAVALSIGLTATLYLGPLLMSVVDAATERQQLVNSCHLDVVMFLSAVGTLPLLHCHTHGICSANRYSQYVRLSALMRFKQGCV